MKDRTNCPHRHDNGNCLPIGGFCTAVDDKNCVARERKCMELLPCPECGGTPKLSSLEPEYLRMKYFCSVHVACGDWQISEELAAADWNRRVKEYQDALQRLKTPGTPDYIEKQGNIKASVHCEDCEYMTDTMTMKDLVFKLSMEGGYIISDKDGGYISQCPKCGGEKLSLECD